MSGMWSKLNLNQKLAAVAFLLGVVATFGTPQPGPVSRIDGRELARIVETGANQISPDELAGWIVAGRADYRLIDLRKEEAFAAYHIPTAERVGVTDLLDSGLARNQNLVLCAEDGAAGAQAWFLLRAQGYRSVRMLTGGLNEWRSEVLFPVAPGAEAGAESQAAFDRKVRISAYFGGQPRAAVEGGAPMTALAAPETAMPEVVVPEAGTPGAPAAPPGGKKKREGC